MSQLEFQDTFEPYYADPAQGGSMVDRDAVRPNATSMAFNPADLKSCRSRLVAVRSRLAELVSRSAEDRSERAGSEQFRH